MYSHAIRENFRIYIKIHQPGTIFNNITVNSEIFVKILFSRIALKDIFTQLEIRD